MVRPVPYIKGGAPGRFGAAASRHKVTLQLELDNRGNATRIGGLAAEAKKPVPQGTTAEIAAIQQAPCKVFRSDDEPEATAAGGAPAAGGGGAGGSGNGGFTSIDRIGDVTL